jgi:hypothetical protein
LQFGFYYDKEFSSGPQEILRIGDQFADKFAVIVDGIGDNTKATVYVKDLSTGNPYLDLDLYVNGSPDLTPSGVITDGNVFYRNWNFVSIKFDPTLSFEDDIGAIRITGPFLINNVSHYQVSEEEYANKVIATNWGTVLDRENNADTETWTETTSTFYEPVSPTWFDVYAESVAEGLGKSLSDVYRAYFGANIKSPAQTNIPLDLSKYRYTAYLNVDGASTNGNTVNQNAYFPPIVIPVTGQKVK